MSRSRLTILVSIVGIVLITLGSFRVVSANGRQVIDLSWPNCVAKIKHIEQGGVVGVNNGLDYSLNPCLTHETQLFNNNYSLYLNTGYPGAGYAFKHPNSPKHCQPNNYPCLAYDYGYNDVLYSLKKADLNDAHSFLWWLDVETANSWVSNPMYNRTALTGMIEALEQNTLHPIIGFYSDSFQWKVITNNWLNHFPVWVATGSSSLSIAKQACSGSNSFTGGPIWMTQYTTSLDYNHLCNVKYLDSLKLNLTFSTKILPV